MKQGLTWVLTLLTAVAWHGAALASVWCGDNGLMRFSFVDGEEIVSVFQAEVGENGTTVVDVYLWLTDVDPVHRDGEAFLATAAVELKLKIEGAEGFVIEQEFYMANRNVGQSAGALAVGFDPGLEIEDGRVKIVHWKVLFQGKPENVVFGLDQDGLQTAKSLPLYEEAGTWALYTGTWASDLLGDMFGAGYVPGHLNPQGEPDMTPRRGKVTWQEIGRYEAR